MSERAGDPRPELESVIDPVPVDGTEGNGNGSAGASEVDLAGADALAASVGPGSAVLVIGSPLPGVGAALAARGCSVTVLTSAGDPVVEPWVNRVGAVDQLRPDPGPDSSFDAIVAPHLLDLAVDPAASLQRVARALHGKGRIVLLASCPPPPGALHQHDGAQVERLCELAGLLVIAATAVTGPPHVELTGSTREVGSGAGTTLPRLGLSTLVVAHRSTGASPAPAGPAEEAASASVTLSVDRQLRVQQAKIQALEEEVRALRETKDRPRSAAVALARSLRVWMRAHV